GGRAERVRKGIASPTRDSDHAGGDDEEKSEQQRRLCAVSGYSREVGREHQRHDGRAKPRARDRRRLTGRRRRATEQDRRKAGDREDQKDSHRQRQLARGQEPDRPAPLIQRREPHAEQRQRTPLFPRGNPREADVQQQEVREQRHGAVLAGREQHRRREAAEQAEHRDEDRVAPDGEQYRNRGDQREQRERDSCRNQ